MVLIIAIVGWLLLLAAIGFILRDFSQFIVKKTFAVRKNKKFVDLGEYAVTWFVVVMTAIIGFIFYKVGTALLAYLLSSDLIGFFRMMRGVFTVNSTVQNPFTFPHFIMGMIGQPLLLLATSYFMYRGLRTFMFYINSRYGKATYNESDLLYFGCFTTLLLIALEILSYSQHLPRISGVVHLVYLGMSKLSLICYFVLVSHLHLLRSEKYRKSLPQYIRLSPKAQKIILNPMVAILFTLGIGMLLSIPLYLGTQFLENNWLVIGFALLSCYLFYKVIRRFVATGYNYFGAIMFFDAEGPLMQPMQNIKHHFFQQKNYLKIVAGLALLTLILKPKLLFFLLFFLFISAVIFGFFHLLAYGFGLGASVILALIRQRELPTINKKTMGAYVVATAQGIGRGATPTGVLVLAVFLLFSLFPKKYEYNDDETYVNAVIDSKSYPMLIGNNDGNVCTPANPEVLPPFLIECLQWQEDRDFHKQQSWWPKWSNWHGISMASLYRMATGTGGGSNLNMQLIKNEAFPGAFPLDFQRKYTEMLAAYQLSLQLSPKEIVAQYFNKVGMIGGNGQQGVVMAGLTAFKRPLQELNELEMLYLVSSLKRSTKFKSLTGYINYNDASDYAGEIKEALVNQAKMWQDKGLMSSETFKILKNQQLRFSSRQLTANINTTTKEFLKKQMPAKSRLGYTYETTLSHDNQQRMAKAVTRFNQYFRQSQIKDGCQLYAAALVVEVATGKVIGHYGGQGVTDLTTFAGGSPMGSVIKPFILLELLESNVATNDLKLYDGKIKGKFTPNNYSRKYSRQMIGINDILSKSLNAPMVNVRQLTPPVPLYQEVEKKFAAIGITEDSFLQIDKDDKRSEHEVNYPLGSRNMTVFDIAQAYQTLFNNGRYRELKVFEKAFNPFNTKSNPIKYKQKPVYEFHNAQAIKKALHHTMLKGGTGTHINHLLPKSTKFYAKTGTSDKGIHGYTILSDGKILIVSYATYGRIKDQHLELNDTPPIPFESGVRSAGVLAAFIYDEWEYKNVTNNHIAFK